MKKIDVIYNLYGYIDEVSDNSIHFEQENDSLQINATIETDKKVRAYIKAPNNNSTVTDELTPVGGVYSCLADGKYMSKGTLYVGYELYDDTGYIERLEPLKIYIDSFVSLDGSNSDNVYVVTVTVGEVETVDFEQPATIENVGTKKDMVLNFKIPRGETGLKGEKGDKGDKGKDSNIENISISCTEFPYDASELDRITKYGMYYVEYGDYATYDGHCFMTVEGNYDEGWISQTLTLGQAVLRREYNYYLMDFEEGSWSEWEERSVTKKYVDNSLKAKAEKTEIPTKVSQLTDDITEHTYNSASTKPQSGKAVAEAIAKLLGSAPENLDTLEELAKALNEDENFSATVLAELAKKQSKEDGKGLSSNDFTDALKDKVLNNTFKGVIEVPFDFMNSDVFDYCDIGIYILNFTDIDPDYKEQTHNEYGLLLVSYEDEWDGDPEDTKWSYTCYTQTVITFDGLCYSRSYNDYMGDGWEDWKKVTVSQSDLSNYVTKEELMNTVTLDCHPRDIDDLDTLNEIFPFDDGVYRLNYICNGSKCETILIIRNYAERNEYDDGYYEKYYYTTFTYFDIQDNKWYELEIEGNTANITLPWYCKGDFIPDLSNYVTNTKLQTKLDKAIGDIETSLENIITKYGLGGDAQ